MFNWFKWKEQKKQDTPVGVSEPVISFVETFKANPKRFKLFNHEDLGLRYDIYILYDSHADIAYRFYYSSYYYNSESVGPIFLDWLTDVEKVYINSVLTPYYKERIKRIKDYKNNKLNNKERQKYMKIYCKSS